MSISNRIKELRSIKKLKQIQFSDHLQVSRASISQYENGSRNPDSSFLAKVCEVYNVNLNWLLTGSGQMFQELEPIDASFLGDTIRLPIVAEISAGQPCEAYLDEPLGVLEIPLALLHFSPPYMVFRVSGRSMEPYVMNRDIIVCSQDWSGLDIDGKIMAFRTPDGITLKKLSVDHQHKVSWLMPINHEFAPVPYDADGEDIVMIGILDISIRKYNQ